MCRRERISAAQRGFNGCVAASFRRFKGFNCLAVVGQARVGKGEWASLPCAGVLQA